MCIQSLLMIGQIDYGSTSWSRMKALQSIVSRFDYIKTIPLITNLHPVMQLLTNHLYTGPKVDLLNKIIIEKSTRLCPEMIWVDKGLHIYPETLMALRRKKDNLKLIHFSPDNQIIRANQSKHYLQSIPLYDVHITTKRHNVDWLLEQGTHKVEYIDKGFDPELHRPLELDAEQQQIYRCDIGFVGHWEPDREDLLLWLWKQGYHLKVWGGGWKRAQRHPLFANTCHLVADDYVRALCGAKINLNILSRWFGDQTTARSVEIPACGKFMLADRTDEHLALFCEKTEAEFFANRSELVAKINYYLSHDDQREAIACAGYARSIANYQNKHILRGVLNRIVAPV